MEDRFARREALEARGKTRETYALNRAAIVDGVLRVYDDDGTLVHEENFVHGDN